MRSCALLRTVLTALFATGCADLFNLDTVSTGTAGDAPGIAPSQVLATQYEQQSANAPITHSFPVQATSPGSTLVLVTVIDTSTHEITSITDSGGNAWNRLVVGDDPDSIHDCHLEVWHSRGASSATTVNVVVSNDRRFAATFMEWPVASTTYGGVGGSYAITATPSTSPLPIMRPSALLAVLAYCETPPPVVDDPALAPLLPAEIGAVREATWFRLGGPGSHSASWTFGAPAPSVPALIALSID